MPKFKFLFSLLVLCFIHAFGFAQAQNVEMADSLRESGKIYVVVAVLLIVLLGLIALLINIDRKLSKLEKQVK
jgi:hypothetical protein